MTELELELQRKNTLYFVKVGFEDENDEEIREMIRKKLYGYIELNPRVLNIVGFMIDEIGVENVLHYSCVVKYIEETDNEKEKHYLSA